MRLRTILLGLIAAASAANAVTISVVPTEPVIDAGAELSVLLQVTGLGAGTAPSLGAYDLNVQFNSAFLAFQRVEWGSGLDLFSTGDFRDAIPGSNSLNLFEVSLNGNDDLNQLQPPNFKLATITLLALTPGESPLTVSINNVADAGGSSLPVDLMNSRVEVVPEPNTWWFSGGGLIFVFRLRARLQRRRALREASTGGAR